MHYTTRPATERDIPALVSLLNELFSQDIEFEPDEEAQTRGLQAIILNPEVGVIYLLESDGIVAGMVNVLFTISTAKGGRVAILEDMIITQKFQSRGYGSILLNYALEQLKASGILRVTLLTDFDNERAHSFYQKSGFSKSAMIPFRLQLALGE